MYTNIEQIRLRLDLGLEDEVLYPDALIESFIQKAQTILESYLGQSLLYSPLPSGDYSEVLSTPDFNGGLLIKLPRRFVDTIDKVLIHYGYQINDCELLSSQYFVAKDEGYIQTQRGAVKPLMFDEDNTIKYLCKVWYKAGFKEIPNDVVEIFYEIIIRVKEAYDSRFNQDSSKSVSNVIREYRTLNEQVKFADNPLNKMGDETISDYMRKVLDKYRMGNAGIGVHI